MFVVGSSSSKKQKQSLENKQRKKKAEIQETDNSNHSYTICSKRKQPGHANAHSPLCSEYVAQKSEVLKNNLGDDYQAFSRRLPFDKAVVEETTMF